MGVSVGGRKKDTYECSDQGPCWHEEATRAEGENDKRAREIRKAVLVKSKGLHMPLLESLRQGAKRENKQIRTIAKRTTKSDKVYQKTENIHSNDTRDQSTKKKKQ